MGHVCIIPETKDFFIAYGDHPEWGTAHTVGAAQRSPAVPSPAQPHGKACRTALTKHPLLPCPMPCRVPCCRCGAWWMSGLQPTLSSPSSTGEQAG